MKPQVYFSRSFFVLILACTASLVCGCGGHAPSSSSSARIVITSSKAIVAGQTTQLLATLINSQGQTTNVTSTAAWTSAKTSIATVTSTGLVTGVAAGTVNISATSAGVVGNITLTVGAPTITALSVTPAAPQLFTGGQQQFTATATLTNGTNQNISSTATWTVTPATVASINATGLLQALAPGNFTVTVTSGSVTASTSGTVSTPTLVSISVSPATAQIASGKTQQFTASGIYTDQSQKDLTTTVTWSSSNTSVLAINASGLATASTVTATTAVTITATSGSISGTAAANVTKAAAVAALIVTPTSSSIAPGSAIQQKATAHYTDGTAQDVTNQVTWSVSASTLAGGNVVPAAGRLATPRDTSTSTASVDQTGIAYATQPGAANVVATLGTVQTQSVLLVRNTTIKALTISTPASTLPVAATQQLALTGLFSDGSTQDLSLTANWQSTDPTLATINSQGLVTAVAAGTTTFTASFGGLTATSGNVQILSASLVSLTIKAPNPVTNVGAVQQLSVIGVFTNGQSQDLTPLASWKSSNTSVFQINSNGFMDAAGVGTAQITATVGNFSTVSNFAALNTTIVSILVLPPTGAANYALGTSLQFTALVTLSGGAQVNLTQAVTWSAADPTVMTIDANGLAKSGKVGTTTIKATLEGFSGSVTATVTNATYTNMIIAPTAIQVAASTHGQFTATGWFSDGSVEDVSHDVLWSVANPAVGSISSSGQVLGVAAGNTTVTATAQSLSQTAPLVVTNAILSSTFLTPGNFELPVNVSRPLYLVGNFSDGTTQDMSADAIWVSPSPSVVYVNQQGLSLSKDPGIGTVGAVLGNFSSSTQVTVTDATLTGITLTPASATIRQMGSQQLTVTGTFSDGYKQSLYLNAVLTVTNPNVIATGPNNLVFGTGIGTSQVTASFQNLKSTTTTFTVLSGVLQTLALTPANPSVTAGGSTQLTAIGTYADSTTSDLSKQVTWTSSNPAVLSVNTSGLATAHATTIPVTVTVTATSGTVTKSFTVTVSPSSESTGSITALTVQPTSVTIGTGSTRPFLATATYLDGTTGDVTGTVAWTSLDLGVAQIDNSGLATGVGLGSTVITATANGIAATGTLTVGSAAASVATLTSIAVAPSSVTFPPGSTQLFTATGTYSDGTIVDISSSVVWQSSNTAAANINSDGVSTGVAVGSTTISATLDGVTGNASVTVEIPTLQSLTVSPATTQITQGNTQQFTATGFYSDQSQKALNSTVVWSSSNTSLLSISATGLATVGTVPVTTAVTVTAQIGTFSATAAVTVKPPAALVGLVVKPTSSSIAPGSAIQQTATAFYADGTQQNVTNNVTWSVTASTLSGGNFRPPAGRLATRLDTSTSTASVDQTGVASAIQAGAANVVASLGAFQSQSTLLVRNTTVRSIRIGTPDTSIPVGVTQQLSLTGLFADGSTQDLTLTANWQSSNTAVATISSRGVVTAVSAGTVVFTASFGGLTQSTPAIQVTATTLVGTTIKVPYSALNGAGGAVEQLSLIGTYADGTTQDLTALASWTSSNPSVIQVSSTGFVQTPGIGNAQITATTAGFSAVTSIYTVALPVTSIQVLPNTVSFALGTSRQFTCLVGFSDGEQFDLTPACTFTSADPTVMTINASGVAKSGKVGNTTITASLQGVSGTSSTETVTSATLTKIVINPGSARFAATTHARFTVIGFFSDGTVQDVTNDVIWTVSDPTIASIDSTGTVYGIAAGTATLTASAQSVTAAVPLTVTNATLVSTIITPGNVELPVDVLRQFYLVGNFSDGSTQDMSADAIWLDPETLIVTVSQTGVGESVTPGVGTLSAQLGNFTAATPVTVTNATLTGITLAPASTTIRLQGSQQMTATGTFSDGFQQDLGADVVFTAANPAVVYLSPTGLAIGNGLGSTQITASFLGMQATTTNFTVLSGTLESIALTPATPSVTSGAMAQLTATGTYADGTTSNLSQQVTWTSSNPAVLSVDVNGLVTAHATSTPTTVTVTATLGAVTQSFTVTVSPSSESTSSITALSVQPLSAVIGAGSTRQFLATATYADGTTANVTGTTTWSAVDPTVATLNSSGLATGVGTGGTLVTATANGISANASLTVGKAAASVATLTSIAVAPSSVALAPGSTQLFTAKATYSDGTIEDISSSVAWQSSNPAAATVTSDGAATAVAIGSTTISATLNGVTGSASVTVSVPTLQSLTVSPATTQLTQGNTQQFTATGFYSDQSQKALTGTVTWSSSNPSLLTISATGFATVGTVPVSTAVTVTAHTGSFTATAAVTVNPPSALVGLAVKPTSSSIAPGSAVQQTAIAYYADGTQQNVTNYVTWGVTASSLSGNFRPASGGPAPRLATSTSSASVDQTGVASAIQPGAANVVATLGSLQSQSLLLVRNTTIRSIQIGTIDTAVPVGATQQLSLTGLFADGSTQDLTLTANWQSSNTAAATVTSQGLVTAVSAGTVVFTATFGGLTQSTPVMQIKATNLVDITIKVPYPIVDANVGAVQQLSLIGTYADGTTQDLTPLASWTSSNPSALQVSNTGFVQVPGGGAAQITATALGFTAVATILANPSSITSIVVLPNTSSFALGTSRQFSAIATFNTGGTFDLTPSCTWTSADPTVMTIDASGVAKSGKAGSTTITATLQGVSGTSSTETVTSATLTKIVINPGSARFAATTHARFTVTGFFSDGSVQDVTSNTVWAVSDPTIASIDSTGAVYGIAPGTATLTASAQSVTATVPLTVTNATLVSTIITPGNAELPVADARQFYLVGNFSDGSTQDMSADAIWLAPVPLVVTVTQTGLGVSVLPGVATLAAQLGNFTAATPVTVTSATLTGITLTPATTTIRQQGSQQMTATGTFSDGFQQDLAVEAVFTAANPAVVYLSPTGLAIGTGLGTTQITASFGGMQATTTNFTVLSGTLDSIALTSATASVTSGDMVQLTATGTYADSTTSNLSQQVTWTSSNPALLSVDVNGLATAHATSTSTAVTVTATLGTITQSTTVTVSPSSESTSSITALTVQPSSAVIGSGSTRQFLVIAKYADGTTANITGTTTWSAGNTGVATLNSSGLATGLATGGTLVTATANGISANASLTVQKAVASVATLNSIAVAPSSATINPGASQVFTATGTYSDGTIVDISSSVVWQSSAPAVATINSTGWATGVSGGTATITAQWQGVSSTAALNVNSVAVAVTAVHVTPLSGTIAVGGTQQFAAIATLAGGGTLNVTSSATWSSSSPAVATINQSGLATGVAVGSTAVSATYNGASGNASVIVNNGGTGGGTNPPLTSITVTPASTSIAVGATQQYTATGTYANGSTANITSTATWTSSNTSTASITTAGLATGVAAGTTAISAASEGLSGSTALTVTASSATLTSLVVTPTSSQIIAGLTQQLAATGTFSDGTTRDVTASCTWASSSQPTATVNTTGQVTGVAAGTATITCTDSGLQSTATVIINAATLQSVAISPSGSSFAAGAAQQFKLTGLFSNGSQVDLTSAATWTSAATNVATVSSTGLVTGVAAGTARISATYQSQSASTTVTITSASLVSIAISPNSATLAKGSSQQFTVAGTYSDGTTHDVTGQATFLSSTANVLTVSSSGLATGVTAGSALISVSADGESATTQTITVTSATLVSISVNPSSPTFAKGTTQQFTAFGTYSDGSVQNLTSQVVWASSTPQTATINDTGLATSNTAGTTQISATFQGVTGTTGTAQVTPAVLTSLAVTPATSQIAKGTTEQFTATGTYSDGTTQNLSSTATWSSSSPTIASISATGLATGNSVGSAQITATFGSFTASTSSFQVTPATLVSIAFSPSSPSIPAGTSVQETVTGTFSDGSTQNLTNSATYSSSNPSAATVNSTGLVTAVAAGSSTITVTVGGVTNTFTATTTAATLSSIAITPANPASIPKGSSEQFTATGTYSDGSTQNLSSTATWSTSNSAVLTVNTSGLATGASLGSATLTAAYQGHSATTPAVQVTAAVVASIAVTPAGDSVVAGSTVQYTATATYTDATTQTVTTSATWSSSNTNVATITSTGDATTVAAGSATISAVYNSITGSTGLTVTPVVAPTLTSIAVTPNMSTLPTGDTQQYTATGTYSDGSTQNLTSQATWTSSAPAIATVNSTGLATGVSAGNAQITATDAGVSGVAALTVSAATLSSISVTPATASIANGTTQQFTATGTLSDGSTENLSSSATWTSSNTGVATINTSGLATATGTGSTTITAQAGSVSGTASLAVTAATVVALQVSPSSVTVAAGATQQLTVTAEFSDSSTQNVTTSATYLSANTGVATVSAGGLVTGTGAGSTSITVSLGSTTTTVQVTTTSVTLVSIAVTPANASLVVGTSQQMTATGTFSNGSTQNLTNTVTWSSSSTTVATVSSTGNVVINAPGTATITATQGGTTGSTTVTGTAATVTGIAVSPTSVTLAVGQSQQFTATATFNNGTQQNVTTSVTWSTSNATVGTISNTSGTNGFLVTNGQGSMIVTATLNSIAGSTSVTVTSAVLTSITVTPSPVSVASGSTQQLTVTGHYSDGSTANVTSSSTWASSASAVATVDVSGVLHGVSPGTATITATNGSLTGQDAATVTNAVLNSISITPPFPTTPLGIPVQLQATGTYSDGSTANITSQVQWSSSAPAVATVSSAGLVSTVSAGSTNITAALGSVSHQAPLTVTSAALESISVQAGQSSFALGLSLQLTAIGTYSDNSTQNLTSLVSWSTQPSSVGVVSSSGVATGLTTGSFTAKATLSGVSGTLSLTVNSAVLQSITVTPANMTFIGLSGPVQFTATGHFSDGSTQNITTTCHWAITSGVSVGSISQTGSFSAIGIGTGTITATSGTIVGSTGFTVVSL